MKIKNKLKLIYLIIFLILISIFFYIRYKPYNYEISYVINKFKITEKYNQDDNKYTILVNYNDTVYPYLLDSKYLQKREIIKNVELHSLDNETCLLPQSEYITLYPLCMHEDNITTYNLSKNTFYKYEDVILADINHDKLTINYLHDNNYLLYNYNGFDYINNKDAKEIKLFDNGVYEVDLIYQLNEYLIVPDYNQKHYFNKINIINLTNGKLEEVKLDNEISFNSVFLGDYKDKIYLLDKKEQKEYSINIKKKKITETDFVILENNKLVKKTFNEIVNNNLKFDNLEKEFYKIIDNKLFQIIDKYKVKISDKDIDKIIKEDNDTVYYLSKEDLYMYNNIYGEILLISNFEWNFNNTNMIYLYK